MARTLVLAACVALAASPCAAQTTDSNDWFTRTSFAPAYVVITNPFATSSTARDSAVRSIPTMTFEVGRQTDGSREWHHMYGLPSYGFGVSVASPGSSMSRPVDAYTFFSWPFAQPSERVQITTDFGMGLSWNWKATDPVTNVSTTVLGSNVNARIDWAFYVRYMLTPQTSLYTGVEYTHRSNGGMRRPDFGVNVFGPSVGLRYNLAPERYPVVIEPGPFRPTNEFIAGAAGGVKNVVMNAGEQYEYRRTFGTFDATLALERRFYRFGRVAFGTDLTYDGGTGAQMASVRNATLQRSAFGDRLSASIYTGYEHIIGRFGALFQVGFKAVNNGAIPSPPRLYERYGWRYHVNDHYWTEFAIRSVDNYRADFLEVGFGYRRTLR